tara:strand:+ start:1206 stop:1469 length:264 start_codon:yes stop_codon:yes gene_type:complete
MRQRCYDSKSGDYKWYGGLGTKVCDRWKQSSPPGQGFWNFVEDMGIPNDLKLTLDRTNTHGDYEPDNCRWITNTENQRNKKKYHDGT